MRQPSVTLVLSSAGHQKGIPEVLLREGLVRTVVRLAPDLDILEAGPAGELRLVRRFASYRLGNRILWAIWWRLPGAWRKFVPLLGWSRLGDKRISRRLPRSDVFHGVMGMCVSSLERAKRLGAVTLIDNPTLHPAAFQREVLADWARAGVRPNDGERVMPAAIIRRCERQYRMCDKIVVYSSAAERSFGPLAYAGKTVVVRPGVDHAFFSPAPAARRDGIFRVCYVGRSEAPKGLHHLTEAWKRLALPDAELVLAGRVLLEMAHLRREGPRARIRLTGILPVERVARCYQDSDLFVFPSVNEGLSLAVLEAMSCGLPVIACRDTGAEDCIAAGKQGLLVPGRNTEALAEAILWCYAHRSELAAMGRAARARVEEEFTLAHYEQRLMELYRSVTPE